MSKYHKYLAMIVALVIAAGIILADKQIRPIRKGLDIAGGVRVVFQADTSKIPPPGPGQTREDQTANKMQSVLQILRSRAGGFQGVVEPIVHLQGKDRVVVELPGVLDPEKAVASLRETASLEFYYLKDVTTERRAGIWKIDQSSSGDSIIFTGPGGQEIDSQKNPELVLEKVVNAYDANKNPHGVRPILTGQDLKPNATSDLDQKSGAIIRIEFNREGAQIFKEFTRAHIGEILAIFYDGKIVTAPTIQDAIPNGQAQISGFKSIVEAEEKAERLNSGALPLPLQIAAKDTVEATLGRDTVNQVILAGLIGLLAVMAFMLIYYKLPGFIADIALVFYALFTFAAFKVMGVTMSLPAIAAFILSIGMAIDANILIFERLKEELDSGKTLRAAIDAGFMRAFTAIFDSNVCTAITSAILMTYGAGAVQSFATTLLIGVAISMFTAITVTRTILHVLVNWGWVQNAKMFGLDTSWFSVENSKVDLVKNRKFYYLISTVIIGTGVFFLITSGLKPGIEFKSGTQITATFQKAVKAEQIQGVVESQGVDNTVQIAEGKTAFITTGLLPGKNKADAEKLDAVQQALTRQVGKFQGSTDEVGAQISKELTRNAFFAVLWASVAIIIYLSFRFAVGGFMSGLKYGVCAVIALIHDSLFIVGAFAIFGKYLNWEVDSLFVTAILTIIGFSVHDTIVIFDRIREHVRNRTRGERFEVIVNKSILETLARSINTSITVLLTLFALLLLGGPMLKHFYVALILGIVIGVYSTIFNASQLVVDWERLFGKDRTPQRKFEDKPLVDTAQVRLSKAASEPEPDAATEKAAVGSSSDKVKPKKKKKRF